MQADGDRSPMVAQMRHDLEARAADERSHRPPELLPGRHPHHDPRAPRRQPSVRRTWLRGLDLNLRPSDPTPHRPPLTRAIAHHPSQFWPYVIPCDHA